MSKKAVYSNKGLAVYITAEHFRELLTEGTLDVRLHIGKVQVKQAWCVVKVLPGAKDSLTQAYRLEQSAIDEARQKFPDADVSMVYKGKQSNRS